MLFKIHDRLFLVIGSHALFAYYLPTFENLGKMQANIFATFGEMSLAISSGVDKELCEWNS